MRAEDDQEEEVSQDNWSLKTLERKLDRSFSSGKEENTREYCSCLWLIVFALYNPELQKSQGKWYLANSSRRDRDSDIQLIQACEKSRRFIHNKVHVWKIQKIYSQ